MDTALKKDIYEYLAPIWTGSFGRDFTAESIVPDTMPDAASVVDAEGIVTLRSKDTQTGAVVLSASVSVSVLYMPEGGGAPQSLSVVIPAEIRADAPGAETDCRTVARMRLRGLDARLVNSRKISLRADLDCEAAVYQRRSLELAAGMADGNAPVHILPGMVTAAAAADVREKTFIITDEYQLPAGCARAERILSQRVEASVEDVKYVTGKLVFRGRVRAALLYNGEDGQLWPERYETEFSQIMEVDADAQEATGSVTLMFTGVYFDLPDRQDSDGRVKAELHLVAQSICRQRKELSYIADIYSNRTCLAGRMQNVTLVSAVQAVTMRQTVTGSAELMGQGGEVLCAAASVGSVSIEGPAVKAAVNVRVILRREDGGCDAARCRLGAEFTTELEPGTKLQNVTVAAADVFCAPAGGGLDVRVVLQMDACAVTETTVSAVCAVEEDEEAWKAAAPAPSVSLVRIGQGTDLWAVAKRYRSTVEAIKAANGERTAGLLLIPKAR